MVSVLSPSDTREVYTNAPLRWVAFEVRFPPVPAFQVHEGRVRAYDALREQFPILGPAAQGFDIQAGPRGASFNTISHTLRLINRQRTWSVVVGPEALVVETTAYTQFEDFAEVAEAVVESMMGLVDVPAMTRLGLRYIDEIRVPGVASLDEWKPYIDDALISPACLVDSLPAASLQGVVEFRLSDSQQAVMRYGAADGHVVDPAGPLAVSGPTTGPFFLLDIDSFWAAGDTEYPEFSLDRIRDITAQLRIPVRALFESAITDELRNEVLRKEAPSPS